jgi:hypothetical protein
MAPWVAGFSARAAQTARVQFLAGPAADRADVCNDDCNDDCRGVYNRYSGSGVSQQEPFPATIAS